MATPKTLNAANFEALGATRLAELLVEISKGNAAAQRRLRLALAGNVGAGQAARAVAKRLTSIAGARTWLGWQKIKPFVADLEAQHQAILEMIAPSDPREAFELLWRLAGCAESVFARSDDGSGRLAAVFHAAVRDLGPLAQQAGLAPDDLSGRVFRALTADGNGTWNELVPVLAPQLGMAGLGMLRTALRQWRAEPVARPVGHERQVIGWASSGPIHAEEIQSLHRRHTATFSLQQIADALGDVDGSIEEIDERARRVPAVAAAIARRLLDAGRPPEAWAALERVEARQREQAPMEGEEARVNVLEALGRSDEAQAFRWQRFLATLSATHLRAHLRKLPDFDDFEAEQHALAHALTFGDVHRALAFLLAWPDLHRASELVLGRACELNGDLHEVLSPAADALDDKHPLAATLLRRAMIGFTLGAGRSSRYKHAARHLRDCRASAGRVADFAATPDQPAFGPIMAARPGSGMRWRHWTDPKSGGATLYLASSLPREHQPSYLKYI